MPRWRVLAPKRRAELGGVGASTGKVRREVDAERSRRAIRPGARFRKVLLVAWRRWLKPRQRQNGCDNRGGDSRGEQRGLVAGLGGLCEGLLRGGANEDCRHVLWPDVVALPVRLGGVVALEEPPEKVGVADPAGSERDPNGLDPGGGRRGPDRCPGGGFPNPGPHRRADQNP